MLVEVALVTRREARMRLHAEVSLKTIEPEVIREPQFGTGCFSTRVIHLSHGVIGSGCLCLPLKAGGATN